MNDSHSDVIRQRAVRRGDAPIRATRHRTCLVDLNNFATFPTLAVGILVAGLREAGHDVSLLVPLAMDVPAREREHREWLGDHLIRRIHLSTWGPARILRDAVRATRYWWLQRPHPAVLREIDSALQKKPDILLLSAYLQHYPTVVEIGKRAAAAGVPLLLGGPAFNLSGVVESWRTIPGLTAIFGGEADVLAPALVDAAIRRDEGALLRFAGVTLPDGRQSRPAPPFRDLDTSPIPDFSGFPWERYRVRIIPMMTGRGCQWSKCNFCSDVVSVNGRTYRTRSLPSVLEEMQIQAERHDTSNFMFLDLKLNSVPGMFRGLAEHARRVVPGAQWIGTVHIDGRPNNGLSRKDLMAAAEGGLRRVSFGLESGSQRLLDLMEKGTTVERNSRFIRDAHAAGISVRCTMFKGYPGETADDLLKTAAFLEEHIACIDRVRFNEFSILEDTPIWNRAHEEGIDGLRIIETQGRLGRTRYVNEDTRGRDYRRAKARVLRAVYAINRRTLSGLSAEFDGLM